MRAAGLDDAIRAEGEIEKKRKKERVRERGRERERERTSTSGGTCTRSQAARCMRQPCAQTHAAGSVEVIEGHLGIGSSGEEWRRGAVARSGAAARDKEALSVQDVNVFTALIYLISE